MKMKNRFISIVLAVVMLFSCSLVVSADNNIKVVIDGNQIAFDVQPQIINGRTLVPLRAIFENLGATVDWNNDTQTVTSVKGNTKISLTINNNAMYVNGTAKTLDVPATLIGGRTLVPVRAISEAFGYQVGWDGQQNIVSIIKTIENYTMLYAPNSRSIAVVNREINNHLRAGWYRDVNLTDNLIGSQSSHEEKIKFLESFKLGVEAHTNAYNCLTYYLQFSDDEFITVFYESLATEKKIFKDLYAMSLKYSDMSPMAFELQTIVSVLQDIESESYTLQEISSRMNLILSQFKDIEKDSLGWM